MRTLFKYNVIQCYSKVIEYFLILGITFETYFLTVSNEGDHLWFYFAYFLNDPPMYEETDCWISSSKHSNNLNYVNIKFGI